MQSDPTRTVAERARTPGDPAVALVETVGDGSMDRYSRELARHLGVATLTTDVYAGIAGAFGARLVGARSFAGLAGDAGFARRLRRLDADLIHLPNHHLGRHGAFLSTPYVVTVHDLIRYFDWNGLGRGLFIHRPNLRDRLALRLDYAGIRRAAALIAVSETTKRDLMLYLGIREDRVAVVYEGVDHHVFRPVSRRVIEEPYVLFVGSEHPRKNLPCLLRAFKQLKREPRFRDVKLVKVGAAGGPEAPFRERTLAAVRELGLERDVEFTGRVGDDDLPAYYSGAVCLALPSYYEGFGFPPLEAMACGCPVVVSTAGALPEIAGDAAFKARPDDADALAAALRTLLTDDRAREDLAAKGVRRAAEFSWQRTADETRAVYETVLSGD